MIYYTQSLQIACYLLFLLLFCIICVFFALYWSLSFLFLLAKLCSVLIALSFARLWGSNVYENYVFTAGFMEKLD
ncbi:hypothetical protein sync_0612 [Synechococcus sp. CC9311]|nr:hypothetical protein sync_0612 [Synechococcus sp. CC9311]